MTIKQLKQQIEAGEALKSLAESYTEIASLKLKRIREDVERNSAFFEELLKVYAMVKTIAARENLKVNSKTKDTVSIILTSNDHFFGTINSRLADSFYKQIQSYQSDLVVIGKAGQMLLSPLSNTHKATFIVHRADVPSDIELQRLANYVQQYNRILVYYSQFKSVLIQLPVVKDIAQNQDKREQNTADTVLDTLGFILEPEISEMLVFFDTQLTALLLQETFLEAELSRTAARLISMDEAQSNATEYVGKQKKALSNSEKLDLNMRILDMINAYSKMRKGVKKI